MTGTRTRTRTAVVATLLGLGAALTASCTRATADAAGPAVATASSAAGAKAPSPAPAAGTSAPVSTTPRATTTPAPVVAVTHAPTARPTPTATRTRTAAPTPTKVRSSSPSPSPTASPTASPSSSPTASPTAPPTATPTASPSASPSPSPTAGPAILSRGDTGEQVRELQARLARAGTFEGTVAGNYGPVTAASVSRYQGRHALPVTGAVDAVTWRTLRQHTRTPTEAEMHPEKAVQPPATPVGTPAGLDSRCLTGRVLCADKSAHRLDWVVDGTVQMTLTVRFGRPSLPTTNGVFQVYWKDIDHKSSIYDDAPMPYAMFFHGGEAVHFSSDFVADGFGGPGGSHGCINTRSRAQTARLFDEVRVGDEVVVHE